MKIEKLIFIFKTVKKVCRDTYALENHRLLACDKAIKSKRQLTKVDTLVVTSFCK